MSVSYKPLMQSVIMLSVVTLGVVVQHLNSQTRGLAICSTNFGITTG
jgi:hypothetical protein